jgi:hypothetical protein
MEQQNRLLRKASSSGAESISSPPLRHSGDEPRSAAGGRAQLGRVPEEDSTFAIGDDDDSDEETLMHPTPSQSSPSLGDSHAPSVASSADESVPHQLRGMSEKARGKMPASQMTFSRQNSTTSLSSSYAANPPLLSSGSGFIPTAAWVSSISV